MPHCYCLRPVAYGPLARLVTLIGFGLGPATERGERRKQLRPIREREGDRRVEGVPVMSLRKPRSMSRSGRASSPGDTPE